MHLKSRTGAMTALLDEYEKAVAELKSLIAELSEDELITIRDAETDDPNCRSVQTILTHVVSSGYSYCIQIMKNRGLVLERPERLFHNTVSIYITELDHVVAFNRKYLRDIENEEMEEFDNSKKILAGWGQQYDIEQMMEHAIVHILRHRRQISKMLAQ